MVVIFDIKDIDTYFPSLDEATFAQMEKLFNTLVPATVNIALKRVVAICQSPSPFVWAGRLAYGLTSLARPLSAATTLLKKVSLVMRGFAQNPTLNTQPNVR